MKKTDCKLLMLVTIISLPLCLSFQNSLIKLAEFQMQCYRFKLNTNTYRLHKIHMQRESLKHPKFLWTLGRGKQTLCMVPVYKTCFPFQVRKDNKTYSEEGKWFGGFVILYNSQKILNCMCMQMCMCLHENSPSKTRLRPCGQAPGVTLICL